LARDVPHFEKNKFKLVVIVCKQVCSDIFVETAAHLVVKLGLFAVGFLTVFYTAPNLVRFNH